MEKKDVKIGQEYIAKVTDKLTTVRILAESRHGGWDAINVATGKKIRIKTAQRLRGPAHPQKKGDMANPEVTESTKAKAARALEAIKTVEQPAAAAKPKAEPKPKADKKHMSILDAAAKVLSEAKAALNCKQMIEAMTQKGYWKPAQGGKTPANTLHAAISKEIKVKGADARFEKAGRGLFEARR